MLLPKRLIPSVVLFSMLLFCLARMCAAADVPHSRGQLVYVPAYSHVFTGPRANPYNLAITLTIRNTDPDTAISIRAIDYHDTNGRLVRRYSTTPTVLAPLASHFVHLEEKDISGGFAPKFLVRWDSSQPVTVPLIEAIMIGATSGQGISFTSHGRVLQER